MKIHFIAVGGSAMHNLAIALHKMGHKVTGSDDEIYEPAKSRLEKYGLLPATIGWNPSIITSEIEAVILGMHAKKDNPELVIAQELGLKVYSYPEFLYEASKEKLRVVIAGSHGKTTITSMVMHVLKEQKMAYDFMVGAQLKGFDTMVSITDAPIMILEGDEYLTSPIDRRPKFLLYKPNIALISGIAWDHINVFPTFEDYVSQFQKLVDHIENKGKLIYYEDDKEVKKIAEASSGLTLIPYSKTEYIVRNGQFVITDNGKEYFMSVFGKHNMENLNGARLICRELGVSDSDFYAAMQNFEGAARRLELIGSNENTALYRDFAHSPSKLLASTSAVKELYPERKLIACMELHTFSSLDKAFLDQYHQTMNDADEAIIYLNPHAFEMKGLQPFTIEEVRSAFNRDDIQVYFQSDQLSKKLKNMNWQYKNLLLMSSGNFDNMDLKELTMFVLN